MAAASPGDLGVLSGNIDKIKNSPEQHLKCPTNGEILDIYSSANNLTESATLIKARYPSSLSSVSLATLQSKVQRIVLKQKSLRKNKQKKQIVLLRDEHFIVNSSKYVTNDDKDDQKLCLLREGTRLCVNENHRLKQDIADVVEENECMEDQLYLANKKTSLILGTLTKVSSSNVAAKQDVSLLRNNCHKLETKCESLSQNLNTAEQNINKLKRKRCSHRNTEINLNKKIKRRDEYITQQSESFEDLTQTIKSLELQVHTLGEELLKSGEEKSQTADKLKRELKKKVSMQIQLSYLKIKHNKRENTEDESHDEVLAQRREILQLRQQIRNLEEINTLLKADVVVTFQNGRYTDELRECIYTLMTECNISMNKMAIVIKTVLRTLTNSRPDRLPSKGLMSMMMVEAKLLASKHAASEMLNVDVSSLKGNCLHTDGTSKDHRHYEGYQVAMASGKTMTIGLKEVAGGDTDTLLSTLKETLADLAETVSSSEDDSKHKFGQLVVSVLNMMTDGASVNHTLVSEFTRFRETYLPLVIDNFSDLPSSTQHQISEVSHFLCKMHLLINCASAADSTLTIFEGNVAIGNNPFSFGKGESGSIRLLRTAAKALTARGSDKAGVHKFWLAYLQEHERKDHLITFIGNRFNIVFKEAIAVYWHRKDISDFLDKLVGPNLLCKSVKFDIDEKLFIGGVRALAIIGHVITTPYERMINATNSILSVNPYLQQMKTKIEEWSCDATELLAGEATVFMDFAPTQTELDKNLYEDTEDPTMDTFTQMALEIMLKSLLILVERQCKDNLQGGKYWDPDSSIQDKTKNVNSTNIISERDMGILGHLLKCKPVATTLCIEACMMWLNNGTADWFASLATQEKETLVRSVRESAPATRKRFQEREVKLKTQNLEKWKAKQQIKAYKEEKQLDEVRGLALSLNDIGGMWTLSNLDDKLAEQEDQLRAVWTQISYHKKVLKSKGARALFQKTSKGKVYSVETMVENLKKILEINDVEGQPDSNDNGLAYKPMDVVKTRLEEEKQQLSVSLFNARNKRKNEQQQVLLPQFLSKPEELVGCQVKHLARDPGQEASWFDAVVDSVHTFTIDPVKTIYNIKYDECEDMFNFPLLSDLKAGDLIIV